MPIEWRRHGEIMRDVMEATDGCWIHSFTSEICLFATHDFIMMQVRVGHFSVSITFHPSDVGGNPRLSQKIQTMLTSVVSS